MQIKCADRMQNVSGSVTREIMKLTSRKEIISFAGGMPATECIDAKEIAKISNEILTSEDAIKVLQYGVTEGIIGLREQFINFVGLSGIKGIDINQTMVVSGGQQGIELLCKAYLNKGDVVLVENPTYLACLQIFNSYEAKTVGVKSDENGLDLVHLEEQIIRHKPKILYVVPTFSNPTGNTYTAENRKAIAEITAKYGVLVLEDDPYSHIRYEGEMVKPIKTYDKVGNVVYVTSLSKLFSPGMRVGAVVADEVILKNMAKLKQGMDLHTNSLAQMIAFKYLESGKLMENVYINIEKYKNKMNAMVNAIDKYMPKEFVYSKPSGGMFIWAKIEGVDVIDMIPKAIARNVAYIQGQVFYAEGEHRDTMRLNFTNQTEDRIEKGIKILAELINEELSNEKE